MLRKIITSPGLYLILLLTLTLLIVNIRYPLVGADYGSFIPRFLDTYLYYLNNGIGIQWWSPSFGGGLPAYPIPVHMQFSLPQLFLFVMNPWLAIVVSIAICILVGYYSLFCLMHRVLSFPRDHAILGATLFSVTGFYAEHLCAGHLHLLLFPLLPLFLLLFWDERLPAGIAGISLGALLAMSIYAAGTYVLVIFLFAIPLTSLVIRLCASSSRLNVKRFGLLTLIGGVIGILLSASRFTAIANFMRFFPRAIHEIRDTTILKAFLGVLAQLFLTPLAFFSDRLAVRDILRNLNGIAYGLWELDIGLSPVVLGLLLVNAILLRQHLRRLLTHDRVQQHMRLLLPLLILIWITLEWSLQRGYLYALLKHLPVMQSLRTNVRFTSIFILPLIMVAMYLYTTVTCKSSPKFWGNINVTLFLTFLAIILYTEYLTIPIHRGVLHFSVSQSLQDWEGIRQSPENYAVTMIAPVADADVFHLRASSQIPYEGIFGPRFEGFTPQTHVGPVLGTDLKFFNLTHPASLVFPEENGLSELFQRILRTDGENIKKFVTYRRPNWNVSTIQHLANSLSLFTLLAVFMIYAGYGIHKMRRTR